MRPALPALGIALVLLTVPCQYIGGQEEKPVTVRMEVKAGGFQDRALRYALLPEPLDLQPGNAALGWLRAGRAAAQSKDKFTAESGDWLDHVAFPLARFPKDRARAIVQANQSTLRLADQAARMDSCDWGMPPLTLQNLQQYLPLDEVQYCREVARFILLQCRLQLSEGKVPEAIRTLQTGFALARHVGEGDTLIHGLVAVAIAYLMLNELEEVAQLPGSPNFYWPLTVLPSPLVDVTRSMRYELDTIYRSVPALRNLNTSPLTPLSPQEVEETLVDLIRNVQMMQGEVASDWQLRLGLAVLTTKFYPEAKQALLQRGWPRENVEAMPSLQVAGLYYIHEFNYLRDEMLKWSSVPLWESKPHLAALEKELAVRTPNYLNPFLLVMPAAMKSRESQGRLERKLAEMRCVEAVRMHVAKTGKPPARLGDIEDAPLPVDPETGKGFDDFYKVEDGVGILQVPSFGGRPANTSRRYEIVGTR
jgi:hypothetical protein